MADIAATDVTYSELTNAWTRANPGYRRIWNVTFGDGALTYPAGGIPVTNAKLGCLNQLFILLFGDTGISQSGIEWTWDAVNNTLRGFDAGTEISSPPEETVLRVESVGY